jgi:hypothetical protein
MNATEVAIDILAWLRRRGIKADHVRTNGCFWEALIVYPGEPSVWRRVVDLLDASASQATA